MKTSLLRLACSVPFVAIWAALFLVSTASAQNEPPSYQHLRDLESFIGTWTTEFDPPGNAPNGTLEVTYRWMGNKSYIQSEVYFRVAGSPADKKLNPEFTVIGYDTDESATTAWMFKYLDQGKLDVVISPRRYVVHQQEGEEGTPGYREQTSRHEINDDGILVVFTKSASGDSESKEEPPLLLSRVD